jgi:hypothetical protein
MQVSSQLRSFLLSHFLHFICSVGLVNSDFTCFSFVANTKLAARYGEGLHIQYLQPEDVQAYSQVLLLEGVTFAISKFWVRSAYD